MRKPCLVVMGVAGAGKSTVGRAVAASLGLPFVEGDDYHPSANRERMAAGIALTDADRRPWLDALAQQLAQANDGGAGAVLACSALRRAYREILRAAAPTVRFIHLAGSAELLAERMAERRGHFMPGTLLQSQLATLEAPTEDEGAWRYDVAMPHELIVRDIVDRVLRVYGPVPGDA